MLAYLHDTRPGRLLDAVLVWASDRLDDVLEAWHRGQRRRDERAAWAAATTLHDMGELVARWALGSMLYQPGGYDDGPAEETDAIRGDLAALNRAGFVTYGSQPGQWMHRDHLDHTLLSCAVAFAQRAAVEGVAAPDLAEHLMRAARAAGMVVLLGEAPDPMPWDHAHSCYVTVATFDQVPDDPAAVENPGSDVTWIGETRFGAATMRDVEDCFGDVPDAGVDTLRAATLVTVIDPVWGRERELWDVLGAAVRQHTEGVQRVR